MKTPPDVRLPVRFTAEAFRKALFNCVLNSAVLPKKYTISEAVIYGDNEYPCKISVIDRGLHIHSELKFDKIEKLIGLCILFMDGTSDKIKFRIPYTTQVGETTTIAYDIIF